MADDRILYLVDGTSQLFRAYFAIRGLSNARGLPTNAVYGFTTMLRKLLKEERPRWIAVAFDLAGPTFRHQRYGEYKANRVPPPDDLSIQVPYAKEVCGVFRIPVLEQAGYEADDLIATFTREAREREFEVVIVAADKDLLQLVRAGVSVLNPVRNQRLDETGVAESFGVPPSLVPDVLGLMGDSIDNIPGVPGVGEKTALSLIATYGGLEPVLARAERFVTLCEARDELVRTLAVLDAVEQVSTDAAAPVCAAAEVFAARIAEMRAAEDDAAFRERLAGIEAVLQQSGLAALRTRAGEPCKKVLRELRAVRRAIADLDKASGRRVWQSLREHEADARLSRELARLDEEVPVPFDERRLAAGEPDREAAARLFEELGFRNLKADLAQGGLEPAITASEVRTEIRVVLDAEGLAAVAEAVGRAPRLGIQTSADGRDPMRSRLLAIGIAPAPDLAFQIPIAGNGGTGLPAASVAGALRDVLSNPAVGKVGHDLKDDLHLFRRNDMPVDGCVLDSMIAAFLLEPDRTGLGLDRLAEEFLGTRPSRAKAPSGQLSLPLGPDTEQDFERAAEDAATALRLAEALESRLTAAGLMTLYRTIDGPLLPVLEKMEAFGIRVDTDALHAMSREMEDRLEQERRKIHELAGVEFNVDSPKQLREVLFDRLSLKPLRRTAKGGLDSTDAASLQELASQHPIAQRILAYRELAKLKGTYVDALPGLVHPATARVHTHFHPTGAATGRLSSSDPNLQNIPARSEAGLRIRSAFVAEPGFVFVSSDYSQIELRVLAHMCGDPGLIEAFRAGEDIHRVTASRVFQVDPALVTDSQRRRAKAVNFGILYGMSEGRLARDQGMTRPEAHRFIEAYFERFGRVREYIERVRREARSEGFVRTMFGRIRRFPQLAGRTGRGVEEAALRAAVNATIQGTAADLMKMAMLQADRALAAEGLSARMLLQVHDELLFEVPRDEVERTVPVIRTAMEGVASLAVPLAVDQKTGASWLDVT